MSKIRLTLEMDVTGDGWSLAFDGKCHIEGRKRPVSVALVYSDKVFDLYSDDDSQELFAALNSAAKRARKQGRR